MVAQLDWEKTTLSAVYALAPCCAVTHHVSSGGNVEDTSLGSTRAWREVHGADESADRCPLVPSCKVQRGTGSCRGWAATWACLMWARSKLSSVHGSVDTSGWSQRARWISALTLTAPSGGAKTGNGASASIHPNTTAAQGWEITRDPPWTKSCSFTHRDKKHFRHKENTATGFGKASKYSQAAFDAKEKLSENRKMALGVLLI